MARDWFKKMIMKLIAGLAALALSYLISTQILNNMTDSIINKKPDKTAIEKTTWLPHEAVMNNYQEMNKTIIKNSEERLKDIQKKHDDVHPSEYPWEWNSISNKSKICWIHKVSRKKICEKVNG